MQPQLPFYLGYNEDLNVVFACLEGCLGYNGRKLRYTTFPIGSCHSADCPVDSYCQVKRASVLVQKHAACNMGWHKQGLRIHILEGAWPLQFDQMITCLRHTDVADAPTDELIVRTNPE